VIKTLELKGYKSLKAYYAFQALLVGLKMLPIHMGETYEDFYARMEAMPVEDQEKLIRMAASLVQLQKDEVEALISFACDANGAPYGPEHLKGMGPKELIEIIVAVSMKFAAMKIDFVSEEQKKN
jgi:hypothetical protein